jgi:hypothetical protein
MEEKMTTKKKAYLLLLPILLLTLAALACGTGYQTSQKITGNSGEVRVRMKEANGTDSTSVEINEDWARVRVGATVILNVETGSCQAVVTDADGASISLSASPGSQGEAYANLMTDGFGEITLETDCQGAQNLDLMIIFDRQ